MATCEHCKFWLTTLKKCALTCTESDAGDYCGSWITRHNGEIIDDPDEGGGRHGL